jgi:hypothetical protein
MGHQSSGNGRRDTVLNRSAFGVRLGASAHGARRLVQIYRSAAHRELLPNMISTIKAPLTQSIYELPDSRSMGKPDSVSLGLDSAGFAVARATLRHRAGTNNNLAFMRGTGNVPVDVEIGR